MIRYFVIETNHPIQSRLQEPVLIKKNKVACYLADFVILKIPGLKAKKSD